MSQNVLSLAATALTFAYEGTSQPVFEPLSFEIQSGWTGVCGANGSGKSTLLHLLSGQLTPSAGSLRRPDLCVLCEQRTDFSPAQAEAFITDYSAESYEIRGNLGIEDEWVDRWDTLSHGERKRLQVGVALWQEPDLLLLDEPTNHLDAASTRQMIRALKSFPGIGILVTHDRALLDDLCGQCLWFQSGIPPMIRAGGYTQGKESMELERLDQLRTMEQLNREHKRLQQTAQQYRSEASRADRKLSNRGIHPRDRDARDKRNLAKVSGKDGVDGKRLRQMEGRIRQLAESRTCVTGVQKQYETGVWMDFEMTHRNRVFSCEPETVPLGARAVLEIPRLEVKPHQRLVLRGPNGSGKSTLLGFLLKHHHLEPHELLYLPQEILIPEAMAIMKEVRELPKEQLGKLMQIVRRLGSDPGRVLESDIASPGELRKILLAAGILKRPAYLLLDEPTNHLDLPSIESLQSALNACPTGFLVVSHDQRFCDALDAEIWELQPERDSRYRLKL